MPKSISIDPVEIRKSGTIKVNDIPANRYKADFKKEEKLYGKDGLIGVFYDMLIIREFETMLDQIKKEGSYQGMEYNHKGPAHLSAGQESASVVVRALFSIPMTLSLVHTEAMVRSSPSVSRLSRSLMRRLLPL